MSPKFVGAIAVLLMLATCGRAHAAYSGTITKDRCNGSGDQCTQSQARQAAELYAAYAGSVPGTQTTYNVRAPGTNCGGQTANIPARNYAVCSVYTPNGTPSYTTNRTWVASGDCPAGQVPDATKGYACFSARDRCLNKNDALNPNSAEIYTGDKCIDGCSYGQRPAMTGTTSDGTNTLVWGAVGFSGTTCTTYDAPAPPPKKEQECLPLNGSQLTVCAKKDGKVCYSASTGKQICWNPGETGTKTDENVAQVRKPGLPPVAPPTPPPGESLNDSNKPTTTTSKTPNGTTSTTTTNNFSTGSGTDAGDSNQGEDPGNPGDDGEDGDKGTAGGGEGCDAPPVCSGDNIGCAALTMTWRVRCSPNNNKIEGGVECGANGEPILVCTGDQVLCRQTLLDSEQVCRARKTDGDGDGQPDWTKPGEGDGTEGAGDEPGENVGKVVTASFGAPMLDETGFSWSRSCPSLGTIQLGYFGSIDLDSKPWMCDFTSLVRSAFYLIGSFLALLIVLGWRN